MLKRKMGTDALYDRILSRFTNDCVGGGWAEVNSGEVIGAQNATQVRQLVSPGVYYAVTHGMRMNIVAPDRIEWPPPYKDATDWAKCGSARPPDGGRLRGRAAVSVDRHE